MFSGKNRVFFVAIVFVLFLSSSSINTDSVSHPILMIDIANPSSVVWFDDFENETETLAEWTVDADGTPDVNVSDGLLYSYGPDLTDISHDSTTAVGTWSIDLLVDDIDDYRIWIVFMANDWISDIMVEGYAVAYDSWNGNREIILTKITDDLGPVMTVLDSASSASPTGWMHIDITRQSDNRMYVFVNGSLILSGHDTRFSSSKSFRLYSEYYFVADNVTVSNTVDFDVAPPYWTESLDDYEIYEGDDFNETLHAFDHSGLDTWWVNDTENFAISQGGNIASVGLLPLGTYGVEVNVNDTFGNVRTGTFSIDVVEEPVPTPTTTTEITSTTTTSPTSTQTNTTTPYSPLVLMFVGIIGGVTVSIIVLVILIRRKT